MSNTNRFSTYTTASTGSGSRLYAHDNDNVSASGVGTGVGGHGDGLGKKKDLWNSMLDSVASGRKLPERNLLVFGGSVDSQREFLESLALDPRRSGLDRQQQNAKLPPVANNLALGYTYYDVLDADQEDILARISLYLLSKPSPSFSSLLQPLLTPQSIPNTLIVILLDWAQPWLWLRQLREWILLLRTVLVSLSPECKEVMEEAMLQWRERGRGGPVNLDGTTAAVDGDALPPGPGEWEDALGLPLCVVCQNAEKTDILEKTQGWKDDEFDLVLQYLRTVLVKHGASLIYTTPNIPSQLPTLIHACLGVTSLLKRQPLKPEVIKRNEVVVPSNWDSWTKILVVREGFEVDKVSEGWSMDLQRPFPPAGSRHKNHQNRTDSANGRRHNGSDDALQKQQAAAAAASIPPTATTGIDGEVVESGEYSYDGPAADDEHDDAMSDLDYYDGAGGLADEDPDSAVSQFERTIRDPGMDVLALADQYNEAAAGDDDDDDDDDDDEDLDEDYTDGDGAHDRDAGGHGKSQNRRRKGRKGRRQQLEVETEDVQLFLGEQLKLLDQFRQKDDAKRDKEAKDSKRRGDTSGSGSGSGNGYNSHSNGHSNSSHANHIVSDAADPAEVISNHIGPVQFNIGGIQVDADDMLERIKNRHYGTASPEPLSPEIGKVSLAGGGGGGGGGSDAGSVAGSSVAGASSKTQRARPAGGKDPVNPSDLTSVDAENLTAFFAGLMNRPSQANQQAAPKS